jgi:hypothetical protein
MALVLTDEDDVRVAMLTVDEIAWAKRLDGLLAKMPARLKLVEVDDRLVLVDRDRLEAAESGSGFGAVRAAGAVLADLTGGTLKISGMSY